ncbi:MAG: hypothetical protein ACR2PH_16870 [Desulfobulbia bacterium]
MRLRHQKEIIDKKDAVDNSMKKEAAAIPILRTKLHRPPISGDHLHRTHLLEQLEKNLGRPLTLVSAPDGYGKTILLSCWLESCGIPG